MSKINYGPTWGTSIVSSHYKYDDVLERDMREVNTRIRRIWDNKPQYLHEMAQEKGQKTKKRKKDAIGTGRQDAELRMVDALRDAVRLLEHHMAEMMDNKIKPGHHSMVNQLQIANALFHLKHKCGVGFDDDSYNERKPLYEYEPQLLHDKTANADLVALEAAIAEQKERREARAAKRAAAHEARRREREAKLRRVKEKLLARGKP